MEREQNLIEFLEYIDPSILSYQEWINVGMALKYEGYTANDWDVWSQSDNRYKPGECFIKWNSFNGSGTPVTAGTIVQMAKDYGGWVSPFDSSSSEYKELDWNDTIDKDYRLIDEDWVEAKEIREPHHWNPVQQLITYIETLFDSTDNVGYVTQTYPIETDDGVIYKPTQGAYDRTAGQLLEALQKCNGDIGSVLGDYKEEAGAWIRFNPLDGNGVKNDNVTEFRYALVESDNMDLGKQYALFKELELPIAALVHSGKKSLHAIVKVDAKDYSEYRKRVDYIYAICKKNGLTIDTQNRNPSRLSRMPGIMRNGRKQFLVDTHIGKISYDDWYKYIEDLNDDLPDPEDFSEFWDNMPNLAPELIQGVLRQGHKLLMAGPSKAGKSFALIEMCIAIAEGLKWLAWQCAQGRVLYVNLELDRASCLHRFKDVYNALGIEPNNLNNIDIWNLRGKTVPMDKLAPKLIRRALKKNYAAVIIDPIYKVLTGDENSADQMAHFTNQFDKVATELGASVIYCHHHSKGSQSGKRSMDRASGSGVFARDPDALIDLVELELTDEMMEFRVNSAKCAIYQKAIKERNRNYFEQNIGLDDLQSVAQMRTHYEKAVKNVADRIPYNNEIERVVHQITISTAWRVEGTLREFAKFKPVDMWFNYPVHIVDNSGVLQDIKLENSTPNWKKAIDKRKSPEEKKVERKQSFDTAYSALFDGTQPVSVESLAEYLDISDKTVRRRVKELSNYKIDGNLVIKT